MSTEVTPDLIERYRRFCNTSTLVVAIFVVTMAVVVALGNLSLLNLKEWFGVLGSLNLAIVAALFFWLFRLKLPKGFTRHAAVVAAMNDERVTFGYLKSYRNAFWVAVTIQLSWLLFQFSSSYIALAVTTLIASTVTFIVSFLWHEWR